MIPSGSMPASGASPAAGTAGEGVVDGADDPGERIPAIPVPAPVPAPINGGGASGPPTDSGSSSQPDANGGAAPVPVVPDFTVLVGGDGLALATAAMRVSEPKDIPWPSLPPGSRVLVYPGNYKGPLTIAANGTAAAPIRIEAGDSSQRPVIANSVDIQNSSYVSISGIEVQSPEWGGFVIRRGSHHITLNNNVIRRAFTGVDVTDGAGTGLVISNNLIEDALTNGIGVEVNGSAAEMNAITGNVVRRSGHHGIELRGSYWRVERNEVSYSGRALAGTSGIHVFSAAASEDSGDNNLVRYNFSYSNSDTGASDGNGIQVDHWCDNNTVAFNIAWLNDGAGINIFEAAGNKVYANTAYANSVDPSGTHGALGEIIVGARSENNRTSGNRIFDNIAVAARAGGPAIYVDSRAYLNPNSVGPNLAYNAAGGMVLRWGDASNANSGTAMDLATGTQGNLVEWPAFAKPDQPLTGGLRLVGAPSGTGIALSGEVDFAGVVAQSGWAFWGAYFTGN